MVAGLSRGESEGTYLYVDRSDGQIALPALLDKLDLEDLDKLYVTVSNMGR